MAFVMTGLLEVLEATERKLWLIRRNRLETAVFYASDHAAHWFAAKLLEPPHPELSEAAPATATPEMPMPPEIFNSIQDKLSEYDITAEAYDLHFSDAWYSSADLLELPSVPPRITSEDKTRSYAIAVRVTSKEYKKLTWRLITWLELTKTNDGRLICRKKAVTE